MKNKADLHYCENISEARPYGPAIKVCYEDDQGRLWAENGEYSSRVNFCPVCGYKEKKDG